MKWLLAILVLLLTAATAFAPPVIGRRIAAPVLAAPAGSTLLLDETGLGSAAAAYSVRKLRSAYGDTQCVRIRRSSDNAEADFGFIGNELTSSCTASTSTGGLYDGQTLAVFCLAVNGFVVTWYDQSGNANNGINATAANQPKIVNAGALITSAGGKPALQFDTTDFLGQTANMGVGTTRSYSMVAKRIGDGAPYNGLIAGSTTPFYQFYAVATTHALSFFHGSTAYDFGATMDTDDQLLMAFWVAGVQGYKNGAAGTSHSFTLTSANQACFIGTGDATNGEFNGTMQEVVIWLSDKTGARATAENNINAFYTIY